MKRRRLSFSALRNYVTKGRKAISLLGARPDVAQGNAIANETAQSGPVSQPKRICIIGNSFIGAVKKAYDTRVELRQGCECYFFANRAPGSPT